jgi:hypothetical protein
MAIAKYCVVTWHCHCYFHCYCGYMRHIIHTAPAVHAEKKRERAPKAAEGTRTTNANASWPCSRKATWPRAVRRHIALFVCGTCFATTETEETVTVTAAN